MLFLLFTVYIVRVVSAIASFELLCIDGNQICSEGVALLQTVLGAANKTLGGELRYNSNWWY